MSYIEREAAVHALAKIINNSDMPEGWNKGMSAAMSALFRIPAADVQPVVRGKWESHGEGFKWVYICSACGYVDGYPMNERMRFCPNCGAKMEER